MSNEFGGLLAQQQAQAALSHEVAPLVPHGVEAVIINVSVLSATALMTTEIEVADGELEPADIDVPFDPVIALREAMYQTGLGTWYSATLRVQRNGAVDGQFNYDAEPEWDAPVDSVAYLTDQERFPRDVENQPEWLQAKLSEARAKRAGEG